MRKIHMIAENGRVGEHETGEGSLPEEYSCYVCKGTATTYENYFLNGVHANEGFVDFHNMTKELKLAYRVKDVEYENVSLSACNDHVPNLNKLELAVKNNDNVLTKNILKESLE